METPNTSAGNLGPYGYTEPQCATGDRFPSKPPTISVIIPVYNVAEYVSESLDSIFSQRYTDIEVILINDGSDDTELLEENLAPYLDRIKYLKQENIGVGPARNIAIGHARGEYLAFLDGDDIWLPEFLESQLEFAVTGNYDLVYSDALIFGNSSLNGRTFMQDAPSDGDADFESLLDLRCNVILSGVLTRKEAVVKAGMFEWERVRAQDFVLWLKMAHMGARIGYQKEVLLKYRMRKESLSGDDLMRIDREINAFSRVRRSMQLSEAQNAIVEKHIVRLNAEKDIQKGKALLLGGQFEAAREAFKRGNEYRKSAKLRSITIMLGIFPGIICWAYKTFRSREVVYAADVSRIQD